VVTDFDERTPRIRAVLKAQGWAEMVEDHRPAIGRVGAKVLRQHPSESW
jgi:hypothetical protein